MPSAPSMAGPVSPADPDTSLDVGRNSPSMLLPSADVEWRASPLELALSPVRSAVATTDMYYLLDTVPPIRVVCKNVATVNIPPKMAASSVISVKVCLWTVCGCKYIVSA